MRVFYKSPQTLTCYLVPAAHTREDVEDAEEQVDDVKIELDCRDDVVVVAELLADHRDVVDDVATEDDKRFLA